MIILLIIIALICFYYYMRMKYGVVVMMEDKKVKSGISKKHPFDYRQVRIGYGFEAYNVFLNKDGSCSGGDYSNIPKKWMPLYPKHFKPPFQCAT